MRIGRKKRGLVFGALLLLSACGGESEMEHRVDPAQVLQPTDHVRIVSSVQDMERGDVMYVDFNSEGKAEIPFREVNRDESFHLLLGTTSTLLGDYRINLKSDIGSTSFTRKENVNPPAPPSFSSDCLSLRLMQDILQLEHLSFLQKATISEENAEQPQPIVKEGDDENFYVIEIFDEFFSKRSEEPLQATAKCVHDNIILYVDDELTEEDLPLTEVRQLCDAFSFITQKVSDQLGELSDVNNDGHLAIVMSPHVNRLNGILGYFNALDLLHITDAKDVIFIRAPDPNGHYGEPTPPEPAMRRLLISTVAHEVQHVVNFNQHVLVRNGCSEEAWLNEGLSHLTEDIIARFNDHNMKHYHESFSLSSPLVSPKTYADNSTRTASYLFLRYLYEQSSNGESFLKRLIQTDTCGIENIEQAFTEKEEDFDSFDAYFRRWQIALIMTDFELTKDPRFTYQKEMRNELTGEWTGVCFKCSLDDGEEFELVPRIFSAQLDVLEKELFLFSTASRLFSIPYLPDSLSLKSSAQKIIKYDPESGAFEYELLPDGRFFGVLIRSK